MSEFNQDIRLETTVFELHPEGHFVMEFTSFKPVQHEQYGTMLELYFTSPELREVDDKPFELRRRVSAKISPRTTLYSFLTALGQDAQDAADEYIAEGGQGVFRLSEYLGRKVGVTVKHEVGGNGTTYANVKDFVRSRPRRTAA